MLGKKKELFFSKYHHLGNDFLIFDDRKNIFPKKDLVFFISHLCDRKNGIGADGVILLKEGKEKKKKMEIFNSNGEKAAGCGNGLLCLFLFLLDEKVVENATVIETEKEEVNLFKKEKKIGLLLKRPCVKEKNILLDIQEEVLQVDAVISLVPHVVCLTENVKTINVEEKGKKIRWHKKFEPHGVNVNFISYSSEKDLFFEQESKKKEKNKDKRKNEKRKREDKEKKIEVRTFERGVEKETTCCGSGAIASAIVVREKFPYVSSFCMSFQQGKIQISFEENKKIMMVGNPKYVFSGRVKHF